MPTSPKRAGRPKTGRSRVVIRLTKPERERLDTLRKRKARGVYVGDLVMKQPLNAFDQFRILKKST